MITKQRTDAKISTVILSLICCALIIIGTIINQTLPVIIGTLLAGIIIGTMIQAYYPNLFRELVN